MANSSKWGQSKANKCYFELCKWKEQFYDHFQRNCAKIYTLWKRSISVYTMPLATPGGGGDPAPLDEIKVYEDGDGLVLKDPAN